MPVDRLKIGREKEVECAKAMVASAQLRVYWIPPRAKYDSQDAFGVFDILGIDRAGAVCGVQVCRKRPSDIGARKSKIEHFCRWYTPALRPIVAYYHKGGFTLEEYLPEEIWRITALLPYPIPDDHEALPDV